MAFEKHCAARGLGRVRCEHRHNFDSAQGFERVLTAYTCVAHTAKRASKSAGLWRAIRLELSRRAATVSGVRLCKVGQLEVDGEGFGHTVRLACGNAVDDSFGPLKLFVPVGCCDLAVPCALRASLPDRELAQFLDGLIKRKPSLLLEHFTEEAT